MGGCRCTYRNCKVRSDGKTHMFHYPVFERVRCHQWLINGKRLDFLNLKVSQLKNRVVCQHHFKDEHFMNFKKDRLTFNAVPTEDGPYCDSSKLVETKSSHENKIFPLLIEDIENEMVSDRKSNFSLKYVDFLTNCDLDVGLLENNHVINENHSGNIKDVQSKMEIVLNKDFKVSTKMPGVDLIEQDSVIPSKKPDKKDFRSVKCLPPFSTTSNLKETFNIVQKKPCLNEPPQNHSENKSSNVICESEEIKSHKTPRNESKVKIISETKLEEPVTIKLTGKFESVTPDFILNVSKSRKNRQNDSLLIKNELKSEIDLTPQVDEAIGSILNVEYDPSQNLLEQEKNATVTTYIYKSDLPNTNLDPGSTILTLQSTFKKSNKCDVINIDSKIENTNLVLSSINNKENNHNVDTRSLLDMTPKVTPELATRSEVNNKDQQNDFDKKPKENDVTNTKQMSLIRKHDTVAVKNKMPSTRVEMIARKRKFNMKLKDIVQSCLEKLDEPDKGKEEVPKPIEELKLNENNDSYPAKEPTLPVVQDYTIAYLETRMQRMENILLSKIDQNSQRIVELKKTVQDNSSKNLRRNDRDEESYKKHLYQEISKYLTPSSNSLIYEELFINKFSPNEPRLKRKKTLRR